MEFRDVAIWAIPAAIVVLGLVFWLFVRRSIRTRLKIVQQLRDDPQITDWLVVFNWTRKVIYVPTIIASLIAAGLMAATYDFKWLDIGADPERHFAKTLGGVWLLIFFLNFLVDEYEMDLKALLLVGLAVAVVVLWLTLMDWLAPFIRSFRHLGVEMNSTGYLLLAFIFTLAIVISWIKGLFYFVALTPNFMNIQNGPNETSEQVSREAFSTRIDTGDFLERMLGFGQIIITFADTRRQPMVLLVGRVGSKAAKLESLRGHLAVEAVAPSGEGATKE
ncbi:MAG: hypothetical protein ACE15C_09780 [Phycisphaerae bacterium]